MSRKTLQPRYFILVIYFLILLPLIKNEYNLRNYLYAVKRLFIVYELPQFAISYMQPQGVFLIISSSMPVWIKLEICVFI